MAAVLLEQAALHLLHLRPPSIRKWAFHLVLAALRFSNCSQPQLANRAYRYILLIQPSHNLTGQNSMSKLHREIKIHSGPSNLHSLFDSDMLLFIINTKCVCRMIWHNSE